MLNTRHQSRAIVRGTLIGSVLALVLGVWLSGSPATDASRLTLSPTQITAVLRQVTMTMLSQGRINVTDAAALSGTPFAAHDNATQVDWLYLPVGPRMPASYLAEVSFQDDGSQWLLTRRPGQPWARVTTFGFPPCPRDVPASVATLWKWPQTGPNLPPGCAAVVPPK